MKRILILCLALCALSAPAQTEVNQLKPGVSAEGVTYLLPRTHFQIVVTAERKAHEPGEFAAFAQRLLRLKNVAQVAYDEWRVLQVEIIPYGVADTSRIFTIKMKPHTSAPLVSLASDGRLLAVNTDANDEPELRQPGAKQTGTTAAEAGDDFRTQEILAAASRSKMAELTANEIYDIRDNRGLLSKGQADFMPKDGEQLRLMLQTLDRQEQALMQRFVGVMTTEEHVFTFDFVPTRDEESVQLFRFSRHFGMVDDDDEGGLPYVLNVRKSGQMPLLTPEADPKKETKDLRYIVPGRAEVSLECDNTTLYKSEMAVAQFGRVAHLGGDLFNKNFKTRLTLSPVTGGISKIRGDE